MYAILEGIIQHPWETGTNFNSTEQQIYFYICGALIIILTVVFIDLVYRVFSHFWNGRR